jgi:hypothetical protein
MILHIGTHAFGAVALDDKDFDCSLDLGQVADVLVGFDHEVRLADTRLHSSGVGAFLCLEGRRV